ncbi:MAG: XcyI family restriction endonuclease [Chloroflexi bacterium]|nr:XcyI family restriction endonuclease [Chloroflexota bacterium]
MVDEAALLAEANRINYRLRSTFFYRKLKEFNTLSFPSMVANLFPVEHLYNWDDRTQWGIGEEAFGYINTRSDFHLFQIFCHPKLLREHPQLLGYYRNIAAISQKGVSYMAKVNVKKIETDLEGRLSITQEQALALAQLFNEHITLIIDSSIQSLSKDELYGIMLISTGAQIDGSWRNAIGEEAERVVQRLLVNETKERNLIGAFIPHSGKPIELFNPDSTEEQLGNIHKYRGILLTNQTSILFSDEPDVSFLDKTGNTIGVIEVKGGVDPAAALERYGAAKKSFEKARRITSNVPTVLIASCITSEVRIRIEQDPIISSYYNLTDLLTENSIDYERFMQQVFSFLENQE